MLVLFFWFSLFAFWIYVLCAIPWSVCFLGNDIELNHWAFLYGCCLLYYLYLIPAWIAVNRDRLVVSFFVLFLVSWSLASICKSTPGVSLYVGLAMCYSLNGTGSTFTKKIALIALESHFFSNRRAAPHGSGSAHCQILLESVCLSLSFLIVGLVNFMKG